LKKIEKILRQGKNQKGEGNRCKSAEPTDAVLFYGKDVQRWIWVSIAESLKMRRDKGDSDLMETFDFLDLELQMRYSLIQWCCDMNFRKGFDRVYLVLAIGWFSWAGVYTSARLATTLTGRDIITAPGFWDKPEKDQIGALSAVAPKFKQYSPEVQRKILQKVHGQIQSGSVPPAGAPPPAASGMDIATAPGFWDKPEKDQIGALSAVSPKFKSFGPDVQKAYLQHLRGKVQSGGAVPAASTATAPANPRQLAWPDVAAFPSSLRPWLWDRFWHEFRSPHRLILAVGLPFAFWFALIALARLARWVAAGFGFGGVRTLSMLSRTQIVLLAGIVATATMAICPPWIQSFEYGDLRIGPSAGAYHWLFSPPGPPQWFWWTAMYHNTPETANLWKSSVDIPRLLIQWAAVAVITGGLLWFLRSSGSRSQDGGGQ
jgi:hypothetical protein